jgi:hypothetical protein
MALLLNTKKLDTQAEVQEVKIMDEQKLLSA